MRQKCELSKQRIEFYRRLSEKKFQEKYNKFLVEGPNVVREGLLALREGRRKFPLLEILSDHEFIRNPDDEEIITIADELGIPVLSIPGWQMKKISNTITPQGIVAVVEVIQRDDEEVLDEILSSAKSIFYFDGIQDPGNVGTLIRSASAFSENGTTCVVLGKGCARLYNPKVIRTTSGAFFKIPVFQPEEKDAEEIISELARKGFRTVAFVADRSAKPVWDLEISEKNVFILGNEGAGIRKSILEISDVKVWIPTSPNVESLNTAVAGSIAMFELWKKRNAR